MSHLPAVPAPDFNLMPGETVAGGLRRISLSQFEAVLENLSDSAIDRHIAIHEVRKSTKRVRALLRMVRPVIGEKIYRAENAVLRDAARLVSGVRDGAVMVDALARLHGRYQHLLAPGVFSELEATLSKRRARLTERVVDDRATLDQVAGVLYRARSRYAAWPIDRSDPRLGAKVIPDAFRGIGVGVGDTYRRGRSEMQMAYNRPTVQHFHQWRKRVKYLRHQMEIITPVWPEVIGGLALSLEQLGDVLGDEHDQAGLASLVTSIPDLTPDPDERYLLIALSNQRRRELHGAARVMGVRVYAESPDQFIRRIKAYWSAWA
ncbi:MAG: CHAD domain-containing protein [Actinomycetota bacterium]